jgi:hypothetical protein
MTKEEFNNLTTNNIVRPIYEKHTQYKIINIDRKYNTIEIEQSRIYSKTTCYSYEHLNIIKN